MPSCSPLRPIGGSGHTRVGRIQPIDRPFSRKLEIFRLDPPYSTFVGYATRRNAVRTAAWKFFHEQSQLRTEASSWLRGQHGRPLDLLENPVEERWINRRRPRSGRDRRSPDRRVIDETERPAHSLCGRAGERAASARLRAAATLADMGAGAGGRAGIRFTIDLQPRRVTADRHRASCASFVGFC